MVSINIQFSKNQRQKLRTVNIPPIENKMASASPKIVSSEFRTRLFSNDDSQYEVEDDTPYDTPDFRPDIPIDYRLWSLLKEENKKVITFNKPSDIFYSRYEFFSQRRTPSRYRLPNTR